MCVYFYVGYKLKDHTCDIMATGCFPSTSDNQQCGFVAIRDSVLSYGNVQAVLLALVLDVASSLALHVANALHEQRLELLVVGHMVGGLVEADVGDVDGGAVAMAGVVGGVDVVSGKTLHIFLCAGDAGDNEAVTAVVAAHVERILEGTANVVEQLRCLGNQIGRRVSKDIDHIM